MAEEELVLRMRAAGARGTARDVEGVSKSIDHTAKRTKKMDVAMGGASKRVGIFSRGLAALRQRAVLLSGVLAGGLVFGAKRSIDAASDLSEEVNKTSVVFGRSADAILKWSQMSATAMGMSRREALAAASNFGGFFKVAGKGQKEAAGLSKRMVGLASDMASFNNTTPQEALEALRSGLSGETEPLRKYRVFLSEAAIQQEAARMGIGKHGKALTEQQKILARYSVIMRQTSDAQGDFRRTSGGAANQQRIFAAQMENLQARLGKLLLPTWIAVTKAGNRFIRGLQDGTGVGGTFRAGVLGIVRVVKGLGKWIDKNSTALMILGGAVAGVTGAYVAFMVIQKVAAFLHLLHGLLIAARAGTLGLMLAQYGLNTAMFANPIGLVVLALAALAGAFVVAYMKVGWFRNAVNAVWSWIKSHWPLLLGILTGPIGLAVVLIVRHFDEIVGFVKSLPGRIAGAASGMWSGLKSGLAAVLNWIIGKWNAVFGPLSNKGFGPFRTPDMTIDPVGTPADHPGSGPAPAAPGHPSRGGVTGLADGTPRVTRPGVFDVGERGRERVYVPAGAAVEPHGQRFEVEWAQPIVVKVDGKVVTRIVTRAGVRAKATA